MHANVAKLTWVLGPKFRPSCMHRKHSQALCYLSSSRCLNFILSINIFSKGEKTSIRKFLIHAPWCSSGTPMLVLLTPTLSPPLSIPSSGGSITQRIWSSRWPSFLSTMWNNISPGFEMSFLWILELIHFLRFLFNQLCVWIYVHLCTCVHMRGRRCCRGQRHITPKLELGAVVNHLSWILGATALQQPQELWDTEPWSPQPWKIVKSRLP